MECVLSINNGKSKITLPYLPMPLKIPVKTRVSESFETINGSINLIGRKAPREMSWSAYLTNGKRSWTDARYTGDNLPYVIKWIEQSQEKAVPCRIVLTHNGKTVLNMPIIIDGFSYFYDQVGDISYDISIKEFIDIKGKKV